MEWQPIETAPRAEDGHWGSEILLFDGEKIAVGFWRDGIGGFTTSEDVALEVEESMQPPPTHWMPLPEPPASGMSAGTAETQSGSGLQPASPAPQGDARC